MIREALLVGLVALVFGLSSFQIQGELNGMVVAQLGVGVAAILVAVAVMILFVNKLNKFVQERPTIKMLALSFLIMVGVALIGEGFDMHIPRGYIYFAMAFSVGVELLNMKLRKR